jgi:hypothetical protein
MATNMESDVQPNVSSTDATTEVGNVVPVAAPAAVATPVAQTRESGVASVVGDEVVLHVRFRPDTTVWEIDECPSHLSKQEWFNLLCRRIADRFASRAGGRGDFRMSRTQLEALKARNAN